MIGNVPWATYSSGGVGVVDISWGAVDGADYYLVDRGDMRVRVDGLSVRLRGLLVGVEYVGYIFAVRGEELSDPYIISYSCGLILSGRPEGGLLVDLLDVDRQSLQMTLPSSGGDLVDCLLRVWWSPSDAGWWGSLELPVNTPVVSSRRLGVGCGLLDRIDWVLAGNLVMRERVGLGHVEPVRSSFRDGTHGLYWESK